MTDLIVKASQLIPLDTALGPVLSLTPPPSPKGRYALAKAANAVGPAVQTFREQHVALLQLHAKKDAEGKPVMQQFADGRQQYDIADMEAFSVDFAAIQDEPIVLAGVRMITHAELGSCPITAAQEAVLIATGLLEDMEPA